MFHKNFFLLCFLLSLNIFLTTPFLAQTTPENGIRHKTPTLLAFIHARIIPSPETVLEDATLLIENGKVIAVGTNVSIPKEATQIDLKGKFIYPGFIDPYSNYGIEKPVKAKGGGWRGGNRPRPDGTRQGGNAWNDAIHAEKDWFQKFKANPKESKSFLNQGITAVQTAKLDGIFRGNSCVVLLGPGLPNDLILKSKQSQIVSFNKGSSKQNYPNSLMGSIALMRQTFLDTEWYQKAHQAYQQNPNQKKPEFNAALAALEFTLPENQKTHFPSYQQKQIIFETKNLLNLLRAHKIGKEFGLALLYVGSNYEYTQIQKIQELNPTLILPLNYPKPPAVETIEGAVDARLSQLRHFERAPRTPFILEQHRVKFAFTQHLLKKKETFLSNIQKAIGFGLSKKSALAALTTIPAEICGVSNEIGTLSPGKLANFIVSSGDIFEKKSKIYHVWIQGNKHEINPEPKVDFRGEYQLNFLDSIYTLQLTGEPFKLKGKLIPALKEEKKEEKEEEKEGKKATELALQILSSKNGKLQFLFSYLDGLELPQGTFRFSGYQKENGIEGYYLNPQGKKAYWAATKSVSSEKEKKETPQEEDSPKSLISKITYPNKAFGFETLPKMENVLIRNATIWTAEESGILKNTDLLILDGKFAQLGKSIPAPKGIKIVDATGKHLTPGIIDEHSHIAISQGVNESGQAITAEVRIGDSLNSNDIEIYRALSGGVTSLQLLHGSANPIGGQAQIIKAKWGSLPEDLKFKGAPASIKFALGENVKQSNWGENYKTRYPQSRMGVETLMKDAFITAQEYKSQWDRYLALAPLERKKWVPPRRDLELEALSEILQSKMFVHCHSYVQSEILMLMRLAEEFNFRIQTFTHILEGYKVASEMAKHGATGSTFSDWWAYKFEVYDAIPYNSALMSEKGVLTSVNSDNSEMGRRLNQEAAKAVTYGGMSQEEAIKLVTINPAIQLKIEKYTGSIKIGKQADFVLWNNNPLSIYARVEQTWIEGKKYFDLVLDQKMRNSLKIEKEALIQKVLMMPQKEKDAGDSTSYTQEQKEWHCDDTTDVWQHQK